MHFCAQKHSGRLKEKNTCGQNSFQGKEPKKIGGFPNQEQPSEGRQTLTVSKTTIKRRQNCTNSLE